MRAYILLALVMRHGFYAIGSGAIYIWGLYALDVPAGLPLWRMALGAALMLLASNVITRKVR